MTMLTDTAIRAQWAAPVRLDDFAALDAQDALERLMNRHGDDQVLAWAQALADRRATTRLVLRFLGEDR